MVICLAGVARPFFFARPLAFDAHGVGVKTSCWLLHHVELRDSDLWRQG